MNETRNGDTNQGFQIIGKVFGTPVMAKGLSWLPVTQLVLWLIMARYAGRKNANRTWIECLGVGALTMPVVAGSEWGHNLAHAAAAKFVAKPMDALHIIAGMPRIIYYELDDPTVTPRQHVARALGGPIFNTVMLSFWLIVQRLFKPDQLAREVTDAAVGVNAFLSGVSLLPIPGIDGGPILKWLMVERGQSVEQADQTVRKANGFLAPVLAGLSVALFKWRKYIMAGFTAIMSTICLGVAKGWLQEKPVVSKV